MLGPACGEEIEIQIDRLGINGEGVGRFEDLAVFVEGALPGEKVKARIYERRKSFARARVLHFFNQALGRVEPSCPLFGRCGGCQLMHLDYEQQLEAKRSRVIDAIKRIGKIEIDVLPCIPSPQPLGYRNKIQLPVGEKHRLGLYARNTHDLIEIEKCGIHCSLGEKAFHQIQKILKNCPPVEDLKHILIKTAIHTEQVLIVLITKSERSPTFLANRIFQSMDEIKGVVQNINPSERNTILSSNFRLLAGEGWIEEKLCGFCFKVSPASFFQVNPLQAEILYNQVLLFAQLTGQERVLDAYCGVGTLALLLAKEAKEVIGIEIVAEAIVDAKENARKNAIENVFFFCAPAEEKIGSLDPIDVAVLNPPRKGCEMIFLKALAEKNPDRIVYVSCDPATLARDLQILKQLGYQLKVVQPFDMFPQTVHVECVALLYKTS